MNGLKLYVNQAGLDQNRQFTAFKVKKFFKIAHAVHDLAGRWWDKNGVTGTSSPDPVLGSSKLAWNLLAPASLRKQNLMDLSKQT